VSELCVRAALIVHHHRAARGSRNRAIPSAALEQFFRFDDYRTHNSPTFMTMPDFSALRTNLAEAEAKAQERLANLFEQTSKDDNGENQ